MKTKQTNARIDSLRDGPARGLSVPSRVASCRSLDFHPGASATGGADNRVASNVYLSHEREREHRINLK